MMLAHLYCAHLTPAQQAELATGAAASSDWWQTLQGYLGGASSSGRDSVVGTTAICVNSATEGRIHLVKDLAPSARFFASVRASLIAVPASAPVREEQQTVAAVLDVKGRLSEASTPPASAPAVSSGPAAVAPQAGGLAPRVYIQYTNAANLDSVRKQAEVTRGLLNRSGFISPPIDKVANVPDGTELRYCRSSKETAQAIKTTLMPLQLGEINVRELPQSLCGKSRDHHYELWVSDEKLKASAESKAVQAFLPSPPIAR
jgi:hypothetical protein